MIVMALWIISSKNVKTRASKSPKIPSLRGSKATEAISRNSLRHCEGVKQREQSRSRLNKT